MLLRRRAEEILSLVDRTEKELAWQEELIEGRIVIGCGELAAMQVLPEIIASFHQQYPLVSYDFFTANADLVKEQMEKGLADIGVLLEPSCSPAIGVQMARLWYRRGWPIRSCLKGRFLFWIKKRLRIGPCIRN